MPGIKNISDSYDRIDDSQAGIIIANSNTGLNDTPEVSALLEEWENQYTSDVTLQPFFSRGAGILLYGMRQARELVTGADDAASKELARFEAAAEPDSKAWDIALRGLISGQ